MKRASYREAVQWIAHNDESYDTDTDSIAGYISTLLIADIFDVEPSKVANDVLRERNKRE